MIMGSGRRMIGSRDMITSPEIGIADQIHHEDRRGPNLPGVLELERLPTPTRP